VSQPPYAESYRLVAALEPGRAVARHRAVDQDGRQVIITVVRPADPDVFLQGVDRVAAVRHADLVPVFEAGRDGADCYVVSEDVEGRDAQALVERGPLDAADAALMAAEAAGTPAGPSMGPSIRRRSSARRRDRSSSSAPASRRGSSRRTCGPAPPPTPPAT